MSYIRTLRGFRPKIEKLGNVLSVNAMRTMEQAKLDAAAVSATVAPEETQAIFAKPSEFSAPAEVDQEDQAADEPEKPPVRRDKPRLSKRARKLSRTEHVDGDFDVKVSGENARESGDWLLIIS